MNLLQRPLVRVLTLLSLIGLVSGCQLVKLHKIDIQQGNLVTQKMVDKLKPGMTKEQVIYVMGRPLAANSFDQSRWDYVHTFSLERQTPVRKVISLYFDGDSLVRFEGFIKPTASVSDPPDPLESEVEATTGV